VAVVVAVAVVAYGGVCDDDAKDDLFLGGLPRFRLGGGDGDGVSGEEDSIASRNDDNTSIGSNPMVLSSFPTKPALPLLLLLLFLFLFLLLKSARSAGLGT